MKLEVVTYPNAGLSQPCERISEITPEIEKLIRDMVETMYEAPGIGLAAPQVGHNIQLITVDLTSPKDCNDLHVILNPEIVESEGEVGFGEGCLSCPKLFVNVHRAERITLKGMDETGKDIRIEAEVPLSTVLQHELDHLNGVTLVDHAVRQKKAYYRDPLDETFAAQLTELGIDLVDINAEKKEKVND